MSISGLFGPGSVFRPSSITIVRTDPNPSLPKSANAAERLAAIARAISLVATDAPDPNKFRPDVVTTQSHHRELELTDHPVETGFRITDHSRRQPDVVEFTGIVSDTPVSVSSFLDASSNTSSFDSRAQNAWEQLNEIFEAREIVFVATSLGTYPSMILKSIDISRDEDSGAAIEFSLVLREMQVRDEILGGPLVDDDALFLGAGPGENGGTLPLVPSS